MAWIEDAGEQPPLRDHARDSAPSQRFIGLMYKLSHQADRSKENKPWEEEELLPSHNGLQM
jgi:hypothetical protein